MTSSGKSLLEKLGWREGMAVRLVTDVPSLGTAFDLPPPADGPAGLVVGFVTRAADVQAVAAAALAHYDDGARLWLAYPKKGSSVATDLTRDKGWNGLPPDLLPVAQISVDHDWSALRFRFRREIPKLTRKSAAAL